jgi:hypothetical protein
MSKVTPNQLNLAPAQAVVQTSETRNNTVFGDLATVGPSVTVNIGVNGIALVGVYSGISPSAASYGGMGFVVSGANTLAASDDYTVFIAGGASDGRIGNAFMLTGLTPGSTTFKAQYKSGAVTTFTSRRIWVIAL